MSTAIAGTAPARIAVAGAGRFGRTILRSFPDRIALIITSRSPDERADLEVGSDVAIVGAWEETGNVDVDLLWLAMADGAVAAKASEIASHRDTWAGVLVLHSSGVLPVEVLRPFADKGATIAAIHPNATLSGTSAFPQGLTWGFTGSADARACIEALLAPFSPVILDVEDKDRPLYHAAAAMAANYTMTLFATAVGLYTRAGIDEGSARLIVASFMRRSIDAVAAEELSDALTGPVHRGDYETVRHHLEALARSAPEGLPLVRELIRTTARAIGATEAWEGVLEELTVAEVVEPIRRERSSIY